MTMNSEVNKGVSNGGMENCITRNELLKRIVDAVVEVQAKKE